MRRAVFAALKSVDCICTPPPILTRTVINFGCAKRHKLFPLPLRPAPFKSHLMNCKPPFYCSTACWMNNSGVSTPVWNRSAWATEEMPCLPIFFLLIRTPSPADVNNYSIAMSRLLDAHAIPAEAASLRKKNAQNNHDHRKLTRTRHSRRSHHRPEMVPPHNGKNSRCARPPRHPRLAQYRCAPTPRYELLPARESQIDHYQFQPGSESPIRVHCRSARTIPSPSPAHHQRRY